ncbi:hypothetical protein BKA66DRAFT_474440 [Pyrenochaeta sp. MPI-SDFR-AT-0127]|nr:hypothetical protein BKA66DRAFT_474440 [Pyrenochaeta sp. MPI-SDFR-AT-0127]
MAKPLHSKDDNRSHEKSAVISPVIVPDPPRQASFLTSLTLKDPGSHNSKWSSPQFQDLQTFHTITNGGGSIVLPAIQCVIPKGFFLSEDRVWTCYRRNYFAVRCSYSLLPTIDPRNLFLSSLDGHDELSGSKKIQSIALALSAMVDDQNAKTVGLYQHTPKRNQGPEIDLEPVILWPVSLPPSDDPSIEHSKHAITTGSHGDDRTLLAQPVQQKNWDLSTIETGQSKETLATVHNFERCQFKSATANNGKRRAQQQYYAVAVSLLVDIRSSSELPPRWVKVAQRCARGLVVRGRSPSHYSSEGAKNIHPLSEFPGPLPTQNDVQYLPTDQGSAIRPLDHNNSLLIPSYSIERTHPGNAKARLSQIPAQAKNDNGHNSKVFLDDSSISSCGTMIEGVAASGSSFTYVEKGANHAEQLTALITSFGEVRELVEACFAMDIANRAERNIRRLLRIFAVKLRSEASVQADIVIARVLRRNVKQIASSLNVQKAELHLPLDQIPTSKDYSIGQYLSEDVVDGKIARAPDSAILGSVNQWEALRQSENTPDDPTGSPMVQDSLPTKGLPINDDLSSTDESGDEKSDVDPVEMGHKSQALDLERVRAFLHDSEALEEFREGLLDFRIAMENAQRNRMIMAEIRTEPQQQQQQQRLGSRLLSIGTYWGSNIRWLRRVLRPSVKRGFRRIEWVCECGEELYADFNNDDSIAIDALEASLRQAAHSSDTGDRPGTSTIATQGCNDEDGGQLTLPADQVQGSPDQKHVAVNPSRLLSNGNERDGYVDPRYLAICTSTGGIYKILTEIDVSNMKSDAELFAAVKTVYQSSRKSKMHLSMLFRPVSVEFIQFTVWSIHRGYISICDRPRCVPPKDDASYEFTPRPLQPLPPVPPEVFVHSLEHKESATGVARYVWTPRLPKRTGKRVIECDIPTYAWGIYIREGPHRTFVFWMVMVTVILSVVLCIIWASLKGDVQGGSGLGALIIAVPSVIMAAFMFKISDAS